jgi:hypothetical protein
MIKGRPVPVSPHHPCITSDETVVQAFGVLYLRVSPSSGGKTPISVQLLLNMSFKKAPIMNLYWHMQSLSPHIPQMLFSGYRF